MKQEKIFISYSRANSDFALKLTKDLKLAGINIWIDQMDIPTGARWDDTLEKALNESPVFLVLLSPESISSQNVKDEIGFAIDAGKRILPVVVKPCTIPLRVRRFQYVDFTNKPYQDSLSEIKKLLGFPEQESTQPKEERPARMTEGEGPAIIALSLMVAFLWAISIMAAQSLARVNDSFGLYRAYSNGLLGSAAASTYVLSLVYLMGYAAAVWLAIRRKGVNLTGGLGVVMYLGWSLGYLPVAVLGQYFFPYDQYGVFGWEIGYGIAGITTGIVTGIIIQKAGYEFRTNKIIIIAIGFAVGLVLGDYIFQWTWHTLFANVDFFSPSMGIAFGPDGFVSGLIGSIVLLSQIRPSK